VVAVRHSEGAVEHWCRRMGTVVRVYDTFAQADRVVRELQAGGVASAAISLIAGTDQHVEIPTTEDAAVAGAGVGAAFGGGAGLLAGFGFLAIPGLGPVVAAGWLASAATCAMAGAAAGGFVGALLGTGIEERDAHVYAEIVRRGGTIVSVRADESGEYRISRIMDQYGPIDISERAVRYREAGWSPSDPFERV
jgi:hypothetical protein